MKLPRQEVRKRALMQGRCGDSKAEYVLSRTGGCGVRGATTLEKYRELTTGGFYSDYVAGRSGSIAHDPGLRWQALAASDPSIGRVWDFSY